MSIGPYGQNGVVRTILISASSGVNTTSRMRSRSITESPISGSRTDWSAFKIFSCFSASATTGVVFFSSVMVLLLPPRPGHEAQDHGQQDAQHDRGRDRRVDGPPVTADSDVPGQAADERHSIGHDEQDPKDQDHGPDEDQNATELGELHQASIVSPKYPLA